MSIDVLLNLQANREPWAQYVDPLSPPKRAHLVADVGRMAAYWNIPFNRPEPRRPQSKDAMSIATLLSDADIEHSEFRENAFAALWQQQKDLGDASVIDGALAGVDWKGLGSVEDGLEKLTQNTIHAYEKGVYGVPTFLHGDHLYFGADRMDVLASRL